MPLLLKIMYMIKKNNGSLNFCFYDVSLSCVARHNILTNQKIFSYGFGPPYEGQKNGNVPMSLSNN
jgi:hypothetical protein